MNSVAFSPKFMAPWYPKGMEGTVQIWSQTLFLVEDHINLELDWFRSCNYVLPGRVNTSVLPIPITLSGGRGGGGS